MVHAAETHDPATRAKTIAPFIEEETIGIIHVDLSRVDADTLAKRIIQPIPNSMAPQAKETKQRAEGLLRTLEKAGVKYIYGVFSLAGSPNDMVFAVVPLLPEIDAAQLLEGPSKLEHGTRVTASQGDYLLIASRETQDRLKRIKPDVRPELEKAFKTAGPAAFQAFFLPPKHTRRTFEEIMPELPEKFGAGPSSVLTRGCLWATLRIDFKPQPVLHGTIQSIDGEAAKALAVKLPKLGHAVADQLPLAYNGLPSIEELLRPLKPHVEGDRIIWTADKKEKSKRTNDVESQEGKMEKGKKGKSSD